MGILASSQITVSTAKDGENGQTLYATCSTAATVSDKVATLENGSLTLKTGSTVSVKFTSENSVASPTLNVAGTGAKTIFVNGGALTSEEYYWGPNAMVTFVYDGTNWNVSDSAALSKAAEAHNTASEAAKVATNFMEYDSTNGLQIGNKLSGEWSGYRTQVKSDSFNVLDASGNTASSFGTNQIELGKNSDSAIIKMCNGNLTIKNITDNTLYTGSIASLISNWLKLVCSYGARIESSIVGNNCDFKDVLQIGSAFEYGGMMAESSKWNNDTGAWDGITSVLIGPEGFSISAGEFNAGGHIFLTSPTISLNGNTGITGDTDIIGNATIDGTLESSGARISGNFETTGSVKIGTSATVGGKNVLTTADVQSGTWTPVCYSIGSPTQAFGTYTKIGKNVTVSFCIYGASSSSSTNSTSLRITGLPFTPDPSVKWFSGGGNASGVKTSANYAFSGFCIEKNANYGAIIVPRCIQTTTAAATRSSGYCTNPGSGTTIYMAGTIMYCTA